MPMINTTKDLETLCASAADSQYITIDTEFMSEKTYTPTVCLIQLATAEVAKAIDPMAEGIDLAPLQKIFANQNVLKVIHSGRQDMAIFYDIFGALPRPLFDTQIAAMVCGYGESVGYQKLAKDIAGVEIDKSSQFTDWSRRPLSEKQINYALSDVIHLRPVYEELRDRLNESDRMRWLEEEEASLTAIETYNIDPYTVWTKLRVRNPKRRTLHFLKYATAWREKVARHKNIPRRHVLKDDALVSIAQQMPRTKDDFLKLRGFPKGLLQSSTFPALMEELATAHKAPQEDWPPLANKKHNTQDVTAVVDLLKVLLKYKSEEHRVASKLIATVSDLKEIAEEDNPDVRALKGWRRKIFGNDALALKNGQVGLRISGTQIELKPL